MAKHKKHRPKLELIRRPAFVLTHSADRRNLVGGPAQQNPKFAKHHRRPTAR